MCRVQLGRCLLLILSVLPVICGVLMTKSVINCLISPNVCGTSFPQHASPGALVDMSSSSRNAADELNVLGLNELMIVIQKDSLKHPFRETLRS